MIVQPHRNSTRPRDHRSRPAVTIGAMVGNAVDAVAAGAAVLHRHVLGARGGGSLDPEETLPPVRLEACPWLTLPGRRMLVDGDPVPRHG
jgi:hypothetical protein